MYRAILMKSINEIETKRRTPPENLLQKILFYNLTKEG